MTTRFRALLVAALSICSLGLPAVTLGGAAPSEATRVTPAAEGSGGVAIDGTKEATRSANVVVTVPPPTTSASVLRLSNDGIEWVERPWSTSVTWSLIDPAAGGINEDGAKIVRVQGGTGAGPWTTIGQASILLDRAGPMITDIEIEGFGDRPIGRVDGGVTDAVSGMVKLQVSLDGTHYRELYPNPWPAFLPEKFLDLREAMIGGNWEPGTKTIHVRGIDVAGNIGAAMTTTVQASVMHVGDDGRWKFRFPKPAVTNEPYTIEPVFEAGFTVPAGRTCQWRLRWGSEEVRLEGHYDETYGEVLFTVSPSNGKCAPWTFTLPYTPPREYTWSLSINSAPDMADYGSYGSFRAELGGTSRAVATSNLPLYYILPDRVVVGATGDVTYRLYAAGGAAAPTGGSWGCDPADGEPANVGNSQTGGTSFTCHVTTSEAWVATWAKFTSTRRWLAGYDPVGDRSKPTMTQLRVEPELGSTPVTGTQRTRIRWSGKDTGSGIRSYTLQVSKNGGSWATQALETANATSFARSVENGATYRYRVRATDRAGNVGAWATSPIVRPAVLDDTTGLATWSTGWSRVPLAGAYAGHVRRTTTAGATVALNFTALSVGLVATRGPDAGFAQVYADGVLVGTVDLYAASVQPPKVVWTRSWPSIGAHTVRVKVLGTASHPAASIDAFSLNR